MLHVNHIIYVVLIDSLHYARTCSTYLCIPIYYFITILIILFIDYVGLYNIVDKYFGENAGNR